MHKQAWQSMKKNQNFVCEHTSPGSKSSGIGGRMRKLMASLLALLCVFYLLYSVMLLLKTHPCWHSISCTTDCSEAKPLPMRSSEEDISNPSLSPEGGANGTDLKHIVFGIAASARLWQKRKEYTKLWWRPAEMRGFVWLDRPVRNRGREALSLPSLKISSSTAQFKYTNEQGHRSALRISRIVSETFRLGLPDVHWFVMGDDDTMFVAENLVRVLSKYDHRQFYYIGSVSESHLQNVHFSYNMAYGGGGFAISYPLAKALESMQDGCIQRYPGLYGSDDRVQACMAELGVPLTREAGFHQFDVYGNLFGLLAAHPISPLVSLHHLDVVEPIFPNLTRLQALQRLLKPIRLDSAGILQQSICYDGVREWSFSVSWGYAVQIFRGIFSPREMELPSRTFLNWYKRADFTAYAFNTRPVSRHPCQKPFVFYMKDVSHDRSEGHIISNYTRQTTALPQCRWKMASPETVDWIQVVKKPSTFSSQQSPRRSCCRVIRSRRRSIDIEVGDCKEGEIIAV